MGAKKSRHDYHVYGEVNVNYDPMFDSKEVHINWQSKVQVVDGEAMVRLDDVEQLFCENEELRQTLFIKMADHQELGMSRMKQNAGQSTSGILTIIRQIERNTNNALRGKDVFNFVYHQLAIEYGVDFTQCPKGKSKLQWLWSEGLLPIVSVQVKILLEVVCHQQRVAPTEFTYWARAVAKSKTLLKRKVVPAPVSKPF